MNQGRRSAPIALGAVSPTDSTHDGNGRSPIRLPDGVAVGRNGGLQSEDRSRSIAHVRHTEILARKGWVDDSCFVATAVDVLGLGDRHASSARTGCTGRKLGLVKVTIPSTRPGREKRGHKVVRPDFSLHGWRGGDVEIAMPERAQSRCAPQGDSKDGAGRRVARAYLYAGRERLAAGQVRCASLPRPIGAEGPWRGIDEQPASAVVIQERLHVHAFSG